MIKLENISKQFGSVDALQPLSLEINQGEWLGLFGHNGSGKTTLIRILLGLATPSGGELLMDGESPDKEAWRAFRSRLGFMPERVAFYEHLTGEETLCYFSKLRGVEVVRVLPMLKKVGLSDAASRKVGGYSKGMRQRLNLAQALIGDPEFLVLDEPIEGLDPDGVRECFELLASGGARTVVLSTHRLSEACRRVERVCLLNQGHIRVLGNVDELGRALDLPTRIQIFPIESANGVLDSRVMELGATFLTRENGRMTVEVPQAMKVDFLTGLRDCRDQIHRMHIKEPTLEEVYFESN